MARKRICNRKQATIWMEGFENSAYRWELRAENRSWSVARVVYHIAMWVSNPRALFFAFQLILDPSYSSWCVSCKELSWVLSKQARPICSAFVFFNQRNSFKLGRKWNLRCQQNREGDEAVPIHKNLVLYAFHNICSVHKFKRFNIRVIFTKLIR